MNAMIEMTAVNEGKIETTIMRLYAVSETPNEDGMYNIIPFDTKEIDFNKRFEQAYLDYELYALVNSFYRGGTYTQIGERSKTGGIWGELFISIGEGYIWLPDIFDRLKTDPLYSSISAIYLLADRGLKNWRFVVAVQDVL